MNKTVTVEIEDLRELVGGADVSVPESGNLEISCGSAACVSTVMCYKFAASPDAGATWTKIKGDY